MAGPGFGDVLTGIVAALLARRMDAFDAASLAAWWHGAAADHAAVRLGGYGLLASECADALPAVEGETRG
jgi:NAD(P)H-hydrate repair Nnr-like enzyme with NAD(P)H-hydrate dehydratase domain